MYEKFRDTTKLTGRPVVNFLLFTWNFIQTLIVLRKAHIIFNPLSASVPLFCIPSYILNNIICYTIIKISSSLEEHTYIVFSPFHHTSTAESFHSHYTHDKMCGRFAYLHTKFIHSLLLLCCATKSDTKISFYYICTYNIYMIL